MTTALAWVSAAEARGQDDDERLALPALRRAGAQVEVVNWDDPGVRWESYDRAVLRSTWDYPQRLDDFRAWLAKAAAATDLRNPLPMVRWNLDKHYLAELDRAGVPVVATTFVEPGETPPRPRGEFVVKPAVGAGSRDAASYAPEQWAQAREHVERLHAAGVSVLVQPLIPSVAARGEWPLVFLGGHYSHAASKRVDLPRAGSVEGLFAEETNRPYGAEPEQIAVARAAVDHVIDRFGVPAYARVDLVAHEGRPLVLELELIEPSLFLAQAPAAAVGRLVEALLA